MMNIYSFLRKTKRNKNTKVKYKKYKTKAMIIMFFIGIFMVMVPPEMESLLEFAAGTFQKEGDVAKQQEEASDTWKLVTYYKSGLFPIAENQVMKVEQFEDIKFVKPVEIDSFTALAEEILPGEEDYGESISLFNLKFDILLSKEMDFQEDKTKEPELENLLKEKEAAKEAKAEEKKATEKEEAAKEKAAKEETAKEETAKEETAKEKKVNEEKKAEPAKKTAEAEVLEKEPAKKVAAEPAKKETAEKAAAEPAKKETAKKETAEKEKREEKAVEVSSKHGTLTMSYNPKMDLSLGESDLVILQRIVEAEATGEDIYGRILVANVVLNRVNHSMFPDSIEGVVFQQGQFSPIRDGRYKSVKVTKKTIEAVERVLGGEDYSKGALYFFARGKTSSSKANWFDSSLKRLFRYGGHEFYKEK